MLPLRPGVRLPILFEDTGLAKLLYVAIGVLAGGPLWILLVRWWLRRAIRRTREIASAARQRGHLVELGTLTGGLAHELKNPLSTIKVNLQLLREDLDSPGAGEAQRRWLRRLESVGEEVTRLQEVLDDFLRFAGKHELRRVPADVRRVLIDLSDFFSPQAAASGVRVSLFTPEEPLIASVDVDLLKQALLNLMINAQQAMTEGGELILRAGRSGTRVQIEVIDTGPGMPPDVAENIFRAYYTTKPGGTGLGLPTVNRIVREHDGQISVNSTPGKGTRFVITLPGSVTPHDPHQPD
jgi:signal transduction histidine kinase